MYDAKKHSWGKQMKEFIKNMYQKPNFNKRFVAVILAVIIMGFALSWLNLVDMGVDAYTSMNLAISERLGVSFGNWQAFLNCMLFIIIILFGREYIGIGTLANMFLVGYAMDFFAWIWDMLLPEGLFDSMVIRIVVLVPALAIFVVAAAVYMDVELGTAPYDAIPMMIAKRQKKISFRVIRIAYDCMFILMGLALGANIGVVTVLMAFTLGPVIAWIGEKMSSFLGVEYE